MVMLMTRTLCSIITLMMLVVTVAAQRTQPVPSIAGESLNGKDSFQAYCATCHGEGGRGDGAVAVALRSKPADLTTLAQRNGDVFPRDRVTATVSGSGRTVAAHGTTEMPIWGPLFRAFEPAARTNVRIENLVAYLETIQVAPSGADAGAALFRTYCASCHGGDAHGAGPVADQLRRLPPDLTTFAMRNGGTFPSERLRGIIDGHGVPSHGDREMPVWGDAFKRTRGNLSDEAIKARIDAIVRYLQAIQQRSA
jgi:mono/diheme cytochrome c family protein